MEETKPQNVVIGQMVQESKVILAHQMRREMTGPEKILWLRLRRNALGVNFRRQQIVDGFIADFYCPTAALVVEVDGPIHDPDYDREGDRIFAKRGIRVLRFLNSDVTERIGWLLSSGAYVLSEACLGKYFLNLRALVMRSYTDINHVSSKHPGLLLHYYLVQLREHLGTNSP